MYPQCLQVFAYLRFYLVDRLRFESLVHHHTHLLKAAHSNGQHYSSYTRTWELISSKFLLVVARFLRYGLSQRFSSLGARQASIRCSTLGFPLVKRSTSVK